MLVLYSFEILSRKAPWQEDYSLHFGWLVFGREVVCSFTVFCLCSCWAGFLLLSPLHIIWSCQYEVTSRIYSCELCCWSTDRISHSPFPVALQWLSNQAGAAFLSSIRDLSVQISSVFSNSLHPREYSSALCSAASFYHVPFLLLSAFLLLDSKLVYSPRPQHWLTSMKWCN